MKAFSAPALGGGSLISLQNGLNRSRGGGFSNVQYSFIFPSKQIFASKKYLSKKNDNFKYAVALVHDHLWNNNNKKS